MKTFFLTFLCFSVGVSAAPKAEERAQRLKEFLQKEKPAFQKRESQKKDALEDLDRLNANQNHVRERISVLNANQQELSMALDNLAMEYRKQKQMEQLHRKQLAVLLKVVHKIKREGVLRFILFGNNLTEMAQRVRVLYRTLRSHSLLSKQMAERAERLAEAERRVGKAQTDLGELLEDLKSQETLLTQLLARKRELLSTINRKQNSYEIAQKEYARVTAQLNTLFDKIESTKEQPKEPAKDTVPQPGSLPIPVMGHLVQGFGRSVNQRFGTITYHKGIEIEAEHNAAVLAVLPGVVEYSGWVKGLGNVMILNHGGTFYSLSAHLFKMLKSSGDKVDAGDTIGTVGDTGNYDKPSLYFELRAGGKALNPVVYFAQASMRSLN
jgi:septal ring factor EnvC (AmiA/AmiB activator)